MNFTHFPLHNLLLTGSLWCFDTIVGPTTTLNRRAWNPSGRDSADRHNSCTCSTTSRSLMTGSMWSLQEKSITSSIICQTEQSNSCNSLESGESGASYGFSAITIFQAVIDRRKETQIEFPVGLNCVKLHIRKCFFWALIALQIGFNSCVWLPSWPSSYFDFTSNQINKFNRSH
jgi:hypothetical protein